MNCPFYCMYVRYRGLPPKIVQLDPNMRTQHSTATLKDPIIVAQNNAHSPVMMHGLQLLVVGMTMLHEVGM